MMVVMRIKLIFVCCFLGGWGAAGAQNPSPVAPALSRHTDQDGLTHSLELAGANRVELETALRDVEPERVDSLRFLIRHMSKTDLQHLSSEFLLENVRFAHQAKKEVPWGAAIPDDIFLNDVLPYAHVDETREPWRRRLFEICRPLVEDCQTASEAAQVLNRELFKKVNVKYSTARRRANQSPGESMSQGLASCTGLSILLADACRSVAVPARLAGIPQWTNKRGNHTWVEIWDGKWHFTGAAEGP